MTVQFYAYIYFDPRPEKNCEPIYVGKGHLARYVQHTIKSANIILERKIAKMKILGLQPHIEIFNAESEEHAFQMEIDFIAKFGRIDLGTGSLCNLTRGGDGVAGYVFTDKIRVKISESRKVSWADPKYRENN